MAQTIDPNDLLLFARVVEAGSFSRAAERVGVPKSTVSRRVAELERRLGERLLLRTTRKLALTEFGQNVLDHARQVATEVEGTLALALHRQALPSGKLRVTMPGDIANLALSDMLASFARAHPAISLELDLSPRRVDLIAENFDVAIRMGNLPADSQLAARRVALFTSGLYASPAYLRTHGEPRTPEVLEQLHGLMILSRAGDPVPWTLRHAGDNATWSGAPLTRTLANSPDLLTRMAISGTGIAAVSDFYVEAHVHRGELQRVLPQWCLEPVAAWAVFPGRRLLPARTRVFIDAVVAALKPCEAMAGEALASHGATLESAMKDRDTSPSSRSADARGDTGTGADAQRSRPAVGSAGDVGGMPSTVDAGMRDKLGDRSDATTNRPVGRDRVRQRDDEGVSADADRTSPASSEDARAAAADEESPLESLGKAISEPVTGSPRSTPDAAKRPR